MARDYAKVSPRFWTGTTGRMIRSAGADAQVVALYLVTGPQSNALGLYYLPLPTIQHETGVPAKGVLKALRHLERLGFAFYDQAEEVVWVPEMARHQVEESLQPTDKRVPWVLKEAARYTKSRFYPEFLRRYSEAFSLPSNGPKEPHRRDTEAPSEPPRSQDQDQEPDHPQDPEHERDQPCGRPAGHERLNEFRERLGAILGHAGPMPVGKDASGVAAFFETQLDAVGAEVLLKDCVNIARDTDWKKGPPGSMAVFVPFLRNLPVRPPQIGPRPPGPPNINAPAPVGTDWDKNPLQRDTA